MTTTATQTTWTTDELTELPVVVIGAGPIGLAAAANAAERGMAFVVLEAGPDAGAAVGEWAHVRLFSAWRELIDPAARRLLEAGGGWTAPDENTYPTGRGVARGLPAAAGRPSRRHLRRCGPLRRPGGRREPRRP